MGDLEFRLLMRAIDLILMLLERQGGKIDEEAEAYANSALARIEKLVNIDVSAKL